MCYFFYILHFASYALKECVRARGEIARGKKVQIPFRSSSLTKVLMESFVRPQADLAVIDSDMTEFKEEVKPYVPKVRIMPTTLSPSMHCPLFLCRMCFASS